MSDNNVIATIIVASPGTRQNRPKFLAIQGSIQN